MMGLVLQVIRLGANDKIFLKNSVFDRTYSLLKSPTLNLDSDFSNSNTKRS